MQLHTRQIISPFSTDELIGTRVTNINNDNLGKIEDIMIQAEGRVAYIVLSYGGIFGTTVADKRLAVPFEAFYFIKEEDKIKGTLNVGKEQLENAPQFDKDNLPDFSDQRVIRSINNYYADIITKKQAA